MISQRPSGLSNANQRKASLGVQNFNTAVALNVDQKVEDIMPA